MTKSKANVIKLSEYKNAEKILSPIRLKDKSTGVICYSKGKQVLTTINQELSEGLKIEIRVPDQPAEILSLPTGVGDVVDADILYLKCKELLRKTVVFTDEKALVLCANYAFSTWLYDLYDDIGYLSIVAAPGSGKTVLLHTMAQLSFNSINFSGATSDSAIFRTINDIRGTLCIDESQKNSTDHATDFHKLLAVGNNRLGSVSRSVQVGKSLDFQTQTFMVFGPKILCGRSIPGDDAILSRCLGVQLSQVSLKHLKDYNITKVSSPTWNSEVEKFKNDMLLYRQRRMLKHICGPDNIKHLSNRIEVLTPREFQVVEWMLKECPVQQDINILFDAILDNKKRVMKRKEEHLEPTVLYTLFDLINEKNGSKIYLTEVSSSIFRNYGLNITPRQISGFCEQNFIERFRNKKGRYILTNSDFIVDRLVQLGFDSPHNSAPSAHSQSQDLNVTNSNGEQNNGF